MTTAQQPSILRRLLRLAGIAALLVAAITGVWVAANWTFVSRLVTYPFDATVTTTEWYTPTERIAGAFAEPLPSAPPASLGMDSRALQRAAAWADAHETSAFLVLRRGTIAAEHYWRGCGPDVPTISHSMAKTLIGLLYGAALERGDIRSLDDGIGNYVAEWQGQDRGEVTIAQLLRMESGLQLDDDREDPFSSMAQVHLAPDLLPTVLGMQKSRPAGRDFEYNNLNTQLLGIALERATKQRAAALLSARIWRPIGARDAAYWLDREGGNAKVYGGVLATARDWARVGELVRNRGRVGQTQVLPPSWIDAMETPSTFSTEYGLHLWLGAGDPERRIPSYVYLDGKAKQRVFVLRSLNLVVVRTGEDPENWSNDDLLALVVDAVTG